jgi:hypothetical protein
MHRCLPWVASAAGVRLRPWSPGTRLAAAALLEILPRSLAPTRTLRLEIEILQAGAYMHEMREKGSKSTRKSQLRVKPEPEEQEEQGLRKESIGLKSDRGGRVKYSGIDPWVGTG